MCKVCRLILQQDPLVTSTIIERNWSAGVTSLCSMRARRHCSKKKRDLWSCHPLRLPQNKDILFQSGQLEQNCFPHWDSYSNHSSHCNSVQQSSVETHMFFQKSLRVIVMEKILTEIPPKIPPSPYSHHGLARWSSQRRWDPRGPRPSALSALGGGRWAELARRLMEEEELGRWRKIMEHMGNSMGRSLEDQGYIGWTNLVRCLTKVNNHHFIQVVSDKMYFWSPEDEWKQRLSILT